MFGYLIQAVLNAAAMLVVLLVFAWILVQAGFVNIDITMAKLFEDDDEDDDEEECWESDEECDCRPDPELDDPEPNELLDEELSKDEVVSDEVASEDKEEVRESEKEA